MLDVLADSGLTWAEVVRIWNELAAPEGWRPEITPEGIFIAPPPSGAHHRIAARIDRALATAIAADLEVHQTSGIAIASIGALFMPDLCVLHGAQVPPRPEPVPAEHLLLAVEITSRNNAEHDRKRKKRAYAQAPIGQYLLVDAFDEDGPTVSLFSDPVAGVYRNTVRTPFGHQVSLAAPVELILDTAGFPR